MRYEPPRRKPGNRPETIEVEGSLYTFVTRQRADTTAIYKSSNAFLRIGDPSRIESDLNLHYEMLNKGFPVSRILSVGSHENEAYFIESSLGEKHLGELFAEDTAEYGSIQQRTFEMYLNIVSTFAQAQLDTRIPERNFSAFSKAILLDALCDELPELSDKLKARFEKVCNTLEAVPFVLSHGDFNPNNLYPNGVIDLEDSFYGPFGYDLIGSLSHIDSFPDSNEYEFYAKYRFTREQKQSFFIEVDRICESNGLDSISACVRDFDFCRAVWLAAKIPHVPKLQKFRYDFVKTLL